MSTRRLMSLWYVKKLIAEFLENYTKNEIMQVLLNQMQ